jgi:hypothetical protein
MPLKQSVKYTIGKESEAGTPVERAAVLPLRDIGTLDRDVTKKDDPIIAGLGMSAGQYAVAGDVKGSIPISPRACTGMGHILKGLLGTEDTPAHLVGVIRIRYTGTSASCKITTSLAGKTIVSAIGALGSESGDAAFGTGGTIDLTAAGFDTLAEVQAAIDAYADYTATLVMGTGTNAIVSVVTTVEQAKGREVFLFLTGTNTGAYLHRFTPTLTLGTERTTYSIQRDGFQDNYLYDGCVFDSLSLSAALKGDLEGSVDVLGMDETAGQEANATAVMTTKPYIFGGGFTSIGGTQYSYVRKHDLKISNNHNPDGYGQASVDRAYHQRGPVTGEGSMTLRLDATSVLERPKCAAGTALSVQMYYFEVETTFLLGMKSMVLVEYNYAEITETPKPEVNGEQIDLGVKFKAFNPGGATDYDDPIVVAIITADTGAF